MAAPLLEIDGSPVDFATAARPVHALRDVSLAGRARPDRRHRRRERLRQVDARLWRSSALLPGNAESLAGSVGSTARDLLRLARRELRALRGRRIADGLPGPDDVAEPGAVDRPADDRYPVSPSARAAREKRRRRDRAAAPGRHTRCRERGSTQYPHQFSGGMRQRDRHRHGAAGRTRTCYRRRADDRARRHDRGADRPSAARAAAGAGGSILFVSHNLGLIAELCDEVVVMYAGEVVERGTVHDIFHRPGHPYTRALLICDPGARRGDRRASCRPSRARCPTSSVRRRAASSRRAARMRSSTAGRRPPGWTRWRSSHRARCHRLWPGG